MQKHITLAGAFFVADGIIGITLGAIFLVTIAGGGIISRDPDAIAITGVVASTLCGLALIFSIPALIGGIGLLRGARWSQPVLLIAAAMNLILVPFGTILGIYGLWVLVQPETTALLRGDPAAGGDITEG